MIEIFGLSALWKIMAGVCDSKGMSSAIWCPLMILLYFVGGLVGVVITTQSMGGVGVSYGVWVVNFYIGAVSGLVLSFVGVFFFSMLQGLTSSGRSRNSDDPEYEAWRRKKRQRLRFDPTARSPRTGASATNEDSEADETDITAVPSRARSKNAGVPAGQGLKGKRLEDDEDDDEQDEPSGQRNVMAWGVSIAALVIGLILVLSCAGGVGLYFLLRSSSSDTNSSVAQGSTSDSRAQPGQSLPNASSSGPAWSPSSNPGSNRDPGSSSQSGLSSRDSSSSASPVPPKLSAVIVEERELSPPVVLPALATLELADPTINLPIAVDPLFVDARKAKIYLSDLQEYAWREGPTGWGFGKNGDLANSYSPKMRICVKGGEIYKGLSMHPPHEGYTRICYALGKQAKGFFGAVTFHHDDQSSAFRPKTRFLILGDGKVRWRTDLTDEKAINEFALDVSDVSVLELRVLVHSKPCTYANAVWIDPFVRTK